MLWASSWVSRGNIPTPTLHHFYHLESHLVLHHNKYTLNSNSSTIDLLLQLSSSQQYCDHPCYHCDEILIYQVLITFHLLFDQNPNCVITRAFHLILLDP